MWVVIPAQSLHEATHRTHFRQYLLQRRVHNHHKNRQCRFFKIVFCTCLFNENCSISSFTITKGMIFQIIFKSYVHSSTSFANCQAQLRSTLDRLALLALYSSSVSTSLVICDCYRKNTFRHVLNFVLVFIDFGSVSQIFNDIHVVFSHID